MDTYERLENTTWPITKFVAQLRNQLTATQFVRSFENSASGQLGRLKLHMKDVHKLPEPIKCSECDYFASQSGNYIYI